MANTTLNVVSLDRPALRADLIQFLRAQDQFRDYDFSGSNLSVLVDLLSYNTNKTAFLVNMLFAEAFLDSAQLRSSVVSHAKELNYLPRSARSASATVTVTFQATGENQPYVVPKGASFSTLVKSTQYVFSVPEAVVVSSANQSFSFTTEVREGEYFKDAYTFAPTVDDPHPSFVVTNPNVDTDSLAVVVFEDDAGLGTTYTQTTSLLDLTGSSRVFFLQVNAEGKYEVLFGDGVVGAQPATGSRVVLDYRVTVGAPANSAFKFAINFDPTGSASESTGVTVATVTPASGGAPPESMGSVKYYAPRWYQTQERASAAPDYVTLLRTAFPEITAATAYGGEEAEPPLFGRVIVSVAVQGLDRLPSTKLKQYTDFLTKRMPLGMRPLFVEPLRTFVRVLTTVKYDVSVTTSSRDRIKSLVTATVTDWNDAHLGDFASTLYYSPFTAAIDRSDPSIVSNETRLTLYKRVVPDLYGVAQSLSLDYQIPLVSDLPALAYPHAIGLETVLTSASFSFRNETVRVEDDGAGNVNLVSDSNGVTALVSRLGTVDYGTGVVSMSSIQFDSFQGTSLPFYARAASADLNSAKNTILSIEPAGIDVTVVPKGVSA